MSAVASRQWNPYEAPATGDNRSRFANGTTPKGWSSNPGDTLSLVASHMLGDRTKEVKRLKPAKAKLRIKRVGFDPEEREWKLVDKGEVEGVITHEPSRPTQFVKDAPRGGAAIDQLLLGECSLPDAQVYEALLECCQEHNIRGSALRQLCSTVICLLALRAGFVLDSARVP